MPTYCAISQCLSNNRGFSGPKIVTHHFPTLESVRKKWISACGKANFVPTTHSAICQKHFVKTDYITHNLKGKKLKRRQLKSLAVPTLFLPLSSSTSAFMHDYGSIHRPIETKALPDQVACEFCEAKLDDTEDVILKHLQDQHTSIVDTSSRTCKLCKYQAKDNVDMFEHFMFPRKREKSACHICQKKFQEVPYGHYRAVHEDYVKLHWLQCDECKIYLTHRNKTSHLKSHIQKVPVALFEPTKIEYKVDEKGQPLVSNVLLKDNFELPALRSKRTNRDERPCQFCNEPVINTKVYILEHLKKQHDFLNKYCHLCNSWFEDSDALLKHLMFQLNEDTTKCFLCDVPYFINRSKLYHIRLHHHDYMMDHWFHCHYCLSHVMKKFEDSHVLRCKRETDRVNYLRTISKDIEGGFCKYCDTPISSISLPRLFYDHMQGLHFEQIKKTWFRCRNVNINNSSLQTACDKVFPTEMIRNDHERMVHASLVEKKEFLIAKQSSKIQYYKCCYCDMIFKSSDKIDLHIGKSHKSIIKHDWHQCSICDLYLPTQAKRKQHELEVHYLMSSKAQQPLQKIEFIDMNSIKREELMAPPTKKAKNFELNCKDQEAKKGMVKCDFCNMYKFSKDLYSHISRSHESAIKHLWFKCSVCDLYLPAKWERDNHEFVQHQVVSKNGASLVFSKVVQPVTQPVIVQSEFVEVKSNPDEQELMIKQESIPIEVKEEIIETMEDPVELVEVKEELFEDEPMEETEDPLEILS